MTPRLLTLNAGSSSVKWALFDGDERVDGGQVEGLGAGAAAHDDALDAILGRVGRGTVAAVGHRVVHGGTRFGAPSLVDDAVLAALDALVPLAPLHQPQNLAGIRAARRAFPGVPQVACFDTMFHRTQPAPNHRFALPRRLHDRGVQRYGFHGLSYESIAGQLAGRDPVLAAGRVVVAHLGNGASMCAMHGGRSVATTMSFSPLDGLPMGTRCGRLDPAVVLYLLRHEGLDVDGVERLLTRESGLLGLSGVASDMRTLEASAEPAAREAIDYFVDHVLRELASMAAALRGIDALVFTGGIGENAAALRERIVDGARWMGLALDRHAAVPGPVGGSSSRVAVWVLRTDEEGVIAAHTRRCIEPTRRGRFPPA